MPLAFETKNRGTIAFGFFNIESDMLLLDRYFFFADAFCALAGDLADENFSGAAGLPWRVQVIEKSADIGDLMGAIHGVRFTGFIGDVYRRYPFPGRQEEFKQNHRGTANRAEMNELINPYAVEAVIRVTPDPQGSGIALGDYLFDKLEFHRLMDYVWLGGYPRWRDGIRPAYVETMRSRVLASPFPLFKNMKFG